MGGRRLGAGRVRHPSNLPEGYHTAPRAQAWPDQRRFVKMLRPGAARSGYARSPGCHTSCVVGQAPRVGRSSIVRQDADQQRETPGTADVQRGLIESARVPHCLINFIEVDFKVWVCCLDLAKLPHRIIDRGMTS